MCAPTLNYRNFFVSAHSVCVCLFADSTPQGCLMCDRGSTLQYNVCYPHCEEGHYFSENVSFFVTALFDFAMECEAGKVNQFKWDDISLFS